MLMWDSWLSPRLLSEIVHPRDFKGSNVMLGEEGGVWLADFGVSRRLEAVQGGVGSLGRSLQRSNSFVGTLSWMAPEIVEQRHG